MGLGQTALNLLNPVNIGRMGKNMLVHSVQGLWNFTQDLSNLRGNALIFSSLAMVTLRSVMANQAAIDARGTDQESFREQQAAEQTLRQMVSWGLSYLFLRSVQGQFKAILMGTSSLNKLIGNKLFDVVPSFVSKEAKELFHEVDFAHLIRNADIGPDDVWKLKPWGQRVLGEVGEWIDCAVKNVSQTSKSLNLSAYAGNPSYGYPFKGKAYYKLLENTPVIGINPLAKLAGLDIRPFEQGGVHESKKLINAIGLWSIMLATPITVFLSGFSLEVFNQKYGAKVVVAGLQKLGLMKHIDEPHQPKAKPVLFAPPVLEHFAPTQPLAAPTQPLAVAPVMASPYVLSAPQRLVPTSYYPQRPTF